jgi:dihydropteroate synthase
VAKACIENGAAIINDISGNLDDAMFEVINIKFIS